MALCGVCNKTFGAKQMKISCSDCEKSFHGTCVKLSKADVDFYSTSAVVWRCKPCSEVRRRSISFEAEATDGKLTLEDVMQAIQDLSNENKQTIKDFNKSYESMSEKMDENITALKAQTEKINKYMEIIENLVIENRMLKEKVQTLEDRLDESEQYSRRNCVELQGVPVANNDVLQTVKDVGTALGMNIQDNMIDACHTLGKKPDSKDPPGIIVKFVRRIDAEDMLAKRRQKKDFSTRHLNLPTDNPIYVNESLSQARRRLFAMARKVKKENGYKWLWVRGGRIFLRKVDDGPVTIVRCQADLGKM